MNLAFLALVMAIVPVRAPQYVYFLAMSDPGAKTHIYAFVKPMGGGPSILSFHSTDLKEAQ
jgi:hypothetical protein